LGGGLSATTSWCRAAAVGRQGLDRAEARGAFDGIVILDGSWSQAKTLLWRNPWMLKLGRIVVRPATPSIYGRLRREPRRDYLSSLEATAHALSALGEPESTAAALVRLFRRLLQRARDATQAGPVAELEAGERPMPSAGADDPFTA
jgi:DTW domain-containing protein YfiP